jgi:integrase
MSTIRKRIIGNDPRNVRWDAITETRGGNQRSRSSKTFLTQKEAKDHLAAVRGSQPSLTASFMELKDDFLKFYADLVKVKKLEASTLKQIREHFKNHVLPDRGLSDRKCADITVPVAQAFLDRLTLRVSSAMAIKVRTTLSRMFSYGARRGFVTFNPVLDTERTKTSRPEIEDSIEPFVLPPKSDLVKLLATAKTFDNTGKAEALVRLLMYGGLRSSEQRATRSTDLDLEGVNPKVFVHQKADLSGKIGKVKSASAKREIRLGPETVVALNRWREAAPTGIFVFSNEAGNPISYGNLWNRFWVPLMNKAGLVTAEPASKVVREYDAAKQADFKQVQFGFHMLRHVFASLQIEQGVSPKRLQKLMGHSTLKLTMDTYGHLWPDDEKDRERADAVEKALKAG